MYMAVHHWKTGNEGFKSLRGMDVAYILSSGGRKLAIS
jgi:hypothetical protein